MKHVPNILSALRLVLAALFPWLPREWWLAAVALALASEFLDGAIARGFGVESRLGAVLDAVADKLFVLAVLVTLIRADVIGFIESALVVARDAVVAWAAAWYALRGQGHLVGKMRVTTPGKLATSLQLALLIALVAGLRIPALLEVTAGVSIFAGVHYIWVFKRGPGRLSEVSADER